MSKHVTREVRVGYASVRQIFQASKVRKKSGTLNQLTQILGRKIETEILRWRMLTIHTSTCVYVCVSIYIYIYIYIAKLVDQANNSNASFNAKYSFMIQFIELTRPFLWKWTIITNTSAAFQVR